MIASASLATDAMVCAVKRGGGSLRFGRCTLASNMWHWGEVREFLFVSCAVCPRWVSSMADDESRRRSQHRDRAAAVR